MQLCDCNDWSFMWLPNLVIFNDIWSLSSDFLIDWSVFAPFCFTHVPTMFTCISTGVEKLFSINTIDTQIGYQFICILYL
jgi:hypothetical protein